MQEAFSCTLVETDTLKIHCQKWGEIGTIRFETSSLHSGLCFSPPQPISPEELPKYENILSEECLGPRGRLALLLGRQDLYQTTLSEALYEKRIERQQVFKVWLSSKLRIFGYRNLPFVPIMDPSGKIDERFDFLIKGTPAQFGVMLRQFAQSVSSKTDYQRPTCQIHLPGSRKDPGNIPPDANPIEANLSLGKSRLSIHAHILPSNETILRIRLVGENVSWNLWDTVRDELEKLGWFTLPEIPDAHAPADSQNTSDTESQTQIEISTNEIWKTIQDVGANREILRLWHSGLTCEQIAVRVSLSAKTVLNRINKLRKEYGSGTVPYRKTNIVKDVGK